jgi:hypothetical protein
MLIKHQTPSKGGVTGRFYLGLVVSTFLFGVYLFLQKH